MICQRAITAFGLTLATLAFPAFSGEVDLPKPGQKWIEVRTDHFLFFSNAGKGATRRVAVDLEELRAVLGELTDYELQSPIPTLIYVFRHDRSFEPYKILYQGKPAAISGYFMAREDANYIAINADSRDASEIVFHEYVHYVSANNLGNLPTWFSEGLAEFYSSFEVIDDTVYIGLPIMSHLEVLRGYLPIPLDQLLAVDRESPLYNEKDRKGEFYAESWALVHYLLLGNQDRRQQLSRFLELIHDGTPEDTAFAAAFGTDYETLAREVRGHLRGPRFRFAQSTAEIDVEAGLSVREMSYSEVLYRLGELLANQGVDRPERTAFFEASIIADPENGLSLSALAIEKEMTADWESAEDLYRRGLRASPDDPTVLFRWGDFLSRRGVDQLEAINALTLSTRLDPTFAPAWAGLAGVYSEAGVTSPEALAAAETAHRLLPTNDEVAGELLALLLRSDRRSRAVELVESSFHSRPRHRAQAWMMILQYDFIRSRELLQDGRSKEAMHRIELAESIADRSSDPEFIRRGITTSPTKEEIETLNELLAATDLDGALEYLKGLQEHSHPTGGLWLDSKIREIERTLAYNHYVETYNHAVDLYNDEDFPDAERILEELLATLPQGHKAASARALLDDVRRAMNRR